MHDDERCCGSGTCIIDPAGCCWCGQQWDGEKMVAAGALCDASTSGSGKEGADPPSALSAEAKN